MTASRHLRPLSLRERGEPPFVERARSAQRKRLAPISTVLTLAASSSGCVPETRIETNPDCVAGLNKAALQAVNRTNPLGQMQIFGGPTSFGPYLKRIEIRVNGARTKVYVVDLTIDGSCNVREASTRLETSDWNLR
jgi:hypothetical protein